ncbi:CBS domain-containing protein [Candidatus Bathyarchaeota archaeon]|nr:CBS domain-containing protein [Candidatus Bathyarchaeota archaeon]
MSIKIGTIQGINIKLNYSWFIIFVLITWSLANGYLPSQYPDKSSNFYWFIGGASALLLYISILIHELAHSTIAIKRGLDIKNITLHFFGGVSQINEESSDPKTEAYMAAVGPLTSIVIGGILLLIDYIIGANLPDTVEAVLRYGGYVNVGLAFFNMIPAFPMDGGRVLRAIIWNRNKNLIKSTRIASNVSNVISIIFMLLGFYSMFTFGTLDGLWLVFIGLFINSASKMGLSQTIISEALGEKTVSSIMTRDVKTVKPDLSIQELIEEWFSVYKHQGYPVMENDNVIGIITIEDVRNVDKNNRGSITVRDVMRSQEELVTVSPDDKASDALMKMASNNVGRLPVIENGRLVGIITRSDINKTIQLSTEFAPTTHN